MRLADGNMDAFGKERPGLQSIPGLTQLARKSNVGFAFFQMSGNIVVAAAQKMQLQTIKGPAQFGEMRNDQRQAD